MFYISKESWDKIISYARAREEEKGHEIGGMAVITKDEDGDYIVQEPVILKQTTTAATCTMDKEALADYYVQMGMKYGNNVHFLWWHSHAKMKAFWSGTDTNTMKEYNNGTWSAFLVVNVREESKFSIQYWDPVETLIDDELHFLNQEGVEIDKAIVDEVKNLCEEETAIVQGSYHNHYDRSGWQRGAYGQGYMWEPEAVTAIKDPVTISDIKVKEYNELCEKNRFDFRIQKVSSKFLAENSLILMAHDLVVDLEDNPIDLYSDIQEYMGGL